MNRLLAAAVWVLTAASLPAFTLSDRAEVSLLTFSPGTELYATFGHTAFRVADPGRDLDLVFNYGTFPFGSPDFYLNFIRGRLDYMLSVTAWEDEFAYQQQSGRQVRELVLALSPDEKQAFFDALAENARPENRLYRYDFFLDNCATRPRDLLEKVLGPRIPWPRDKAPTALTFRDRLDPYLARMAWAHWGINLVLGVPADQKTSVRDAMFLPDALEAAVQGTALVKTAQVHNEPAPLPAPAFDWTGPGPVLWALAALTAGLTAWELRRGRRWRVIDGLLFAAAAFVGLVILFLWFLSDHSPVRPNLNLLWSFPLGIVLVFFSGRDRRWLRAAWAASAAQAFLGLLLSVPGPWVPQRLDPVGIPFLLMLAGRALLIFWLPPAPARDPKKRHVHPK